MKKVKIYLILVLLLFVVGCNSSEETISITEQIDQLIVDGNITEATKKINENELTDSDLENAQFNYDELIKLNSLFNLYDNEDFLNVAKFFNDQIIDTKLISEQVIDAMNSTFNYILENEDIYFARFYFDGLQEMYKSYLSGDFEERIINREKEIENEKKAEAEKLNKEIIEYFLGLIYNQEYSAINGFYNGTRNELTEMFFSLALAYQSYYEDDFNIYLVGEKSLPELYLDDIENPIPEVKELMQSLQALIDIQKREGSKDMGVIIGMTVEQVLASQWGEPQRINTTTSTFGTREQWVYGNGHYLYFKDGILVSISTRQ